MLIVTATSGCRGGIRNLFGRGDACAPCAATGPGYAVGPSMAGCQSSYAGYGDYSEAGMGGYASTMGGQIIGSQILPGEIVDGYPSAGYGDSWVPSREMLPPPMLQSPSTSMGPIQVP
jgi:hypothetical protein